MEDLLAQTHALYKAKTGEKAFSYVSGWEVLRKYPKWGSASKDLSNTAPKKRAAEEVHESTNQLDSTTPGKRPAGRDTSKKQAFGAASDPLERLAAVATERNRIMQDHQDYLIMKMNPGTAEAQIFFADMQQQILSRRMRDRSTNDSAVQFPSKAAVSCDNTEVFLINQNLEETEVPPKPTCRVPDCEDIPLFGTEGKRMYCPNHMSDDMEYYGF